MLSARLTVYCIEWMNGMNCDYNPGFPRWSFGCLYIICFSIKSYEMKWIGFSHEFSTHAPHVINSLSTVISLFIRKNFQILLWDYLTLKSFYGLIMRGKENLVDH